MQNQYRDLIKLYADREYTGKSIILNNVSHSKIRELEILGETTEVGEGTKSPDNPFTLVGAKSPAITVNGQTLPMVSKNLYNPAAGNYTDLSENLGVDDEGYIYLKNSISPVSTQTDLMFSYKKSNVFKSNTKYAFVVEIKNKNASGNITIYVCSDGWKNSFFDDSFLVSDNGVYKKVLTTISDFTNRTVALRSMIRINNGASLTSLKFRISVYCANDIDITNFVYQPYKDMFELNSVGNAADTYNPLTGEYVQRVGKLVLDGTEDWTEIEIFQNTRRFVTTKIAELIKKTETSKYKANLICSHYNTLPVLDVANGANGIGAGTSGSLSIRDTYLYIADFKSFLAAQYTAGTPVTVLYELADPITTTINQTNLKANIPDTIISLTEANNLGSIRAILQTKGE